MNPPVHTEHQRMLARAAEKGWHYNAGTNEYLSPDSSFSLRAEILASRMMIEESDDLEFRQALGRLDPRKHLSCDELTADRILDLGRYPEPVPTMLDMPVRTYAAIDLFNRLIATEDCEKPSVSNVADFAIFATDTLLAKLEATTAKL